MQGAGEKSAEKHTEQLYYELFRAKNLNDYYSKNAGVLGLPKLAEMLKGFCEKKELHPVELFKKADIDAAFGYQIFAGLRNPTRDYLLRLALGLGLDVRDCQHVLKAGGRGQLHPRDERDSAVIFCLHNGMSCKETDDMLFEMGYQTLKNAEKNEKR
jgi:hypothetical protein